MKKKILVIDDEEILTKTFVRLLEKSGYDAFFVKSGTDALEVIQDIEFDLIMTDIRMPGLSGVETMKGLKQYYESAKKKRPPIIVVTGFADEQMEREIMALSPEAFIRKPFEISELLECVKKNL